ncbi:MAG: potassium transporter [Betaproteobacteria bacterium RIFCSPLOWO2_12_FULL_67_28]|nr:MAG: potassium transporter [Betaproteobacteria bacterium RIFCSPLOWO2_12_FULL_67_28]
MENTGLSLNPILVLLASAVLVVIACRRLHLPPMVGYLAIGLVLGPHAAGLVQDTEATRRLAEFGVVFLMFSVGLEFSLPKLRVMRRVVFGLGLAQVALTIALAIAAALALGAGWQTGLALGGAAAMSSTAMVSRLLAERLELDTPHGREIIGVLLFQDLAVVPLLILLPALGQAPEDAGLAVAAALGKAAVVLAVLILAGPRLMRSWFGVVARARSTELFVLNVLFITLGLAYVTGVAGLSLALGAFLAGMLIAETEYRFQVEEDIKPFRDVLLGLFFVTVGMLLDPAQMLRQFWLVVLFLLLLFGVKLALIGWLSRAFGSAPGTALRVGLGLAQGGEFGFVLLTLASAHAIAPQPLAQALLAAMVLSMLATPFVIAASDRIVLRFARSEWLMRSLELHRVAVQSLGTERHVIILGYGRNGQHLARLLEAEGVRYVALDLDPERVREAALAGDTVVFADSSRREALVAAGLSRAAAVAVTFADSAAAARVLAHIHALNPSVPVIARARDESDVARLTAAGASEVVPEALESGLMLASHTLIWVGVPLSRVVRRMRAVRDERYSLLKGLFHGASDEPETVEAAQSRLHGVTLAEGAQAIGKPLAALGLEDIGVQVKLVRRPRAARRLAPHEVETLEEGDIVVLLGVPELLAAAEMRLLQG